MAERAMNQLTNLLTYCRLSVLLHNLCQRGTSQHIVNVN